MNYRHHFHAGNFADVVKHVLLLDLVQALQKKETGFLYLDTHAGRGRYDLTIASQGDSLAREPEHPKGIGRLLEGDPKEALIQHYLEVVRAFDLRLQGSGSALRFYPGSPWLVKQVLRPQDRMYLCERHPEEYALLADEFSVEKGVSVHPLDGYQAMKAAFPPKERRALVLIDPPFEDQDEFEKILAALSEGLKRLPSAVVALWYPLTSRARADAFLEALERSRFGPTLSAELFVAGESSGVKMRGSGLAVINPPWQTEKRWPAAMHALQALLAQAPGGSSSLRWIVPEAR